VPLTLLAASVAARLGRRHPAARESERGALRPEAPCIGRDPLLADLRRRRERNVTALCVDSRPPLPAPCRRCLSASPAASGWIRGHGAEPPSVSEVTRRRFFGSGAAFRLLQLTRPVGAPHVERSTLRPCGLSCLRTAPAPFAALSVPLRGRRVPRVPPFGRSTRRGSEAQSPCEACAP